MRLVTYEVKTPIGAMRRTGLLRNNDTEVIDLNNAYQWLARERGSQRWTEEASYVTPTDMIAFLERGDVAMKAGRDILAALRGAPTAPNGAPIVLARKDVKLLAPVPRPRSIREHSTWEDHMSSRLPPGEAPKDQFFYKFPSAYKGNPASVTGPEDPIPYPYYTHWLDPEPELGIYVGKHGRDLSIEKAAEHVAGYTIFIDTSARDVGGAREPFGPYKHKDFHNAMGPCIVTPDEFNERDAKVTVKINGETVFEGNTGHRRQFWSPTVLAYDSDNEDVFPGDFSGMGTVGKGAAMDTGRFVKPGDIWEVTIQGIGTMRLPIVEQKAVVTWVRDGLPSDLKPHANAPDGNPPADLSARFGKPLH